MNISSLRAKLSRSSSFVLVLWLFFTTAAFAQSIEIDKELGAENAAMVASQMGIYQDEELTEYVVSVGKRLVAQLDNPQFEFEFHVVDDPTPNAFALPGGYVYVTRGLLSLMVSEDELACVMGHEIIHVTRRHSIKQMKKSILPRLLELPGRLVGSVIDEDVGRILNAPIEVSNNLLLASHSRKHETESDTQGIALAAKAGYDPMAMSTILTRLNDAVEIVTEQESRKSYFDDHPYTPDRVSNIAKVSANLDWQTRAPEADNFPMPLQSMIFGKNPGQGVFKGAQFIHPDLDFTITFPAGWSTVNKPESVGAVNEDRNAFIFLGIADPDFSPEQHGKLFIKRVREQYKTEPTQAETVDVSGKEGYIVSVMDRSGSAPMLVHQLWVQLGEQVYHLIGTAPEEMRGQLERTALSLGSLNDKQRQEVTKMVVHISIAEQGETITALSERSKSVLKPEYVAVLNALDFNSPLSKGQMVKVIVEQAYQN